LACRITIEDILSEGIHQRFRPDRMRIKCIGGDYMEVETVDEHKESDELHDRTKRTKRIIVILFVLALFSLGMFIIMRLLLGRTP
jgi:hypothetical protein